MRKLLSFLLIGVLAFSVNVYAEQQIDEGQQRGQTNAVSKFFVARNAREGTLISADRVVIWDTTSNDGVTVTTSTTSFDPLVAGVTIDAIVGITSDNTAADSSGTSNWGRVRVYGRHAAVSWDSGDTICTVGGLVAHHNLAGEATSFLAISEDVAGAITGRRATSRDSFGVALEGCAADNKDLDIFVNIG